VILPKELNRLKKIVNILTLKYNNLKYTNEFCKSLQLKENNGIFLKNLIINLIILKMKYGWVLKEKYLNFKTFIWDGMKKLEELKLISW